MKSNGNQISHYDILEQLGQGGMAVIYKAYDTRLEREVAIKVIRAKASPALQYERLFKRFEREAISQAQFNHPNIVPVFDYGIHEGSPYLVMEYIPGGTLKDRIKGHMEYHQAIEWILPIADALQYAHEHGIVHRDVKPSNILINRENQPVLTDFGIAKVLDTQDGTLTATGMGVGTPEYMAPEQWKGQSSEASDQYALGVILYELLTGQKPYTAETPVAIALKQMNDPLPRPSTLAPGIPAQVEKVLFKALAKDPRDRYPDMRAFQQALADAVGIFIESYQAEYETGEEKPVQVGKGKKKSGWIWAVASITLVAVAIIIFLGFGGGWTNLLSKIHEDTGIGGDEISSVDHVTTTPTPLPSPTKTPETSPTITELPTITPTPEVESLVSFFGRDAIYSLNVSENQAEKIVEIIPSDAYLVGIQNDLIPASWDRTGRYVFYQPLSTKNISPEKSFGKGLFLIDLLEKKQWAIFEGEASYIMGDWNPNSLEYYFLSDVEGELNLFGYNVIEENLFKIVSIENPVSSAEILYFRWSPDGRYAVFPSNIVGKLGLFLFDTKNLSLELITNRYKLKSGGTPFWDQMGENVIFSEENFTGLKIYNIKSGEVSSLVNLLKQPSIFVRSPDSNFVYYQMDGDYSTEGIYLLNIDNQMTYAIEAFNNKYRHEFIAWKDSSKIFGLWNEAASGKAGYFEIDMNNLEVTYQERTEISDDGTIDPSYYSMFLKKFDGIYYFYQIPSGFVFEIEEGSWSVLNRFCFSSMVEFDIGPSFKFSNKRELLINDNGRYTYIDSYNSIIHDINISEDIFNIFFGDNQPICRLGSSFSFLCE